MKTIVETGEAGEFVASLYYTMADVAAALGVHLNVIAFKIQNRLIPPPAHRFGKRMFYSQKEYEFLLSTVKAKV